MTLCILVSGEHTCSLNLVKTTSYVDVDAVSWLQRIISHAKICKARIVEERQENEATSLWMDESSEALRVSSWLGSCTDWLSVHQNGRLKDGQTLSIDKPGMAWHLWCFIILIATFFLGLLLRLGSISYPRFWLWRGTALCNRGTYHNYGTGWREYSEVSSNTTCYLSRVLEIVLF